MFCCHTRDEIHLVWFALFLLLQVCTTNLQQMSSSEKANNSKPLIICLKFIAAIALPWFFRELTADKPEMTCWSLLCGYPRRITQIKIHSAEGLQEQDGSGGKCKTSLEEWKGLLQSSRAELSWHVTSQKLSKEIGLFFFPTHFKICSKGELRWIRWCKLARVMCHLSWCRWTVVARLSPEAFCRD